MSSGVIVIPANHGNKMSTKDIIQDMRNASDEVLMQMAREIVEKQCADSKVLDLAGEARIPKFSSREITLGRVLGRGGFCIVREIEKIKTSPSHGHAKKSKGSFMFRMMKPCLSKTPERKTESKNTEDDCDSVSDIPRAEVAARSKKSRKSRGRYVLKQVAPDLKHSDKITYMKGTVDMAMEAQFLSALDHPNILRLTGVNAQGPYSDGYFLVLEKLNETLSRKIKTWMNMDRQCKGITGVFAGSKRKEEDLYRDRIEASYDIAAGAAYLHEKNVVFRDLKPDNIGYDTSGVLKIFDFGLAKELKDCDKTSNGLYKLTGFTGAVRYMAPEVGLYKAYNLSADVYSWSMIMWFILALEPPFGLYTNNMIADRVFVRGSRPAVFKKWKEPIANLMQQSWDADLTKRPSFREISNVLKHELIGCDGTVAGSMTCSSQVGSVAEGPDEE